MNADVRKLCGVSAATANRILVKLVVESKLKNISNAVIEHIEQYKRCIVMKRLT